MVEKLCWDYLWIPVSFCTLDRLGSSSLIGCRQPASASLQRDYELRCFPLVAFFPRKHYWVPCGGNPLFLLFSCFFFFFSLGHCKPRGGRNLSLCAWQEWGDDWRCALRFREVLIYPAPLGGTQGIAKWSSKSRVLTHSLFFRKNGASELTGVRSTELVVSYILYSCGNKPWYVVPGTLPLKEPPGARCVLGIPDVNLFL